MPQNVRVLRLLFQKGVFYGYFYRKAACSCCREREGHMNEVLKKARTFIYRNARPLDLARFQYHFENGSQQAVMQVLSCYQNEDGGFGHAVEADCWNPNSTPLHASTAGSIIQEIDWSDTRHPVIQRLLKWYESGAHFNGKTWELTVESNNAYPHAPWWHTGSVSSCHTDYNGTAQIAGFIVRYAPRDSCLFHLGVRIAREAISSLSPDTLLDQHTCACYLHMAELFEKADAAGYIPFDALKEKLRLSIQKLIVSDTSQWGGYVCKPSCFIRSKKSEYYPDNKEAADYECSYILDTQLADGSWEIAWSWEDYPDAWAISKNWWRGRLSWKTFYI